MAPPTGAGVRLPLVEGDEALRVCGAGVVGPRTDQPIACVLLENVRGPARHPADREDRRVEIDTTG